MKRRRGRPTCIVIAGLNGAGKTTLAREYLPKVARVIHFVNADLIAQGLAPFDPGLAAIAAARLLLQEINRLATHRVDFAFESTLSGMGHARRIAKWKGQGYRIEIAYLRLKSPQLALRRIAARVRQGGHNVPRTDVLRRFERGWDYFVRIYRPLADEWAVYDNSGEPAELLEPATMREQVGAEKGGSFATGIGRGLRLAARTARKVARAHGTRLYVWENGKVVAKRPSVPTAPRGRRKSGRMC
jgi:predicted ABC-type ATPase